MKTQGSNRNLTVALMAVSFFQSGMVVLATILSSVMEAFPGTSELAVQMATTFTNLAMMAAAGLDGVIEKRIGRRGMVVTGLSVLAVMAVLGRFCSVAMWTVYVWSGMLGIGIGLFLPAVGSMLLTYYDGGEREKLTGLQSVFVNGGGMVMSLLAGFLAATLWKNAYLTFLLVIPALILSLRFLPRGRNDRQQKEERSAARGSHPKLPASVWSAALGTCGFAVCYFVFTTNISCLLGEKGLNTTTMAGVVTACFMLGGALSGILLPKAMETFKSFMPALAFIMLAVCYITLFAARSPVPVCIAAFIGGGSISFFFPYLLLLVGGSVDPAISVITTSLIISIGPNLGSFVSPLIVTNLTKVLLGGSVACRFLLASIVTAVIAGNIIAAALLRKRKPEEYKINKIKIMK